MTHRVDDLKISFDDKNVTITAKNRGAWDNEPAESSITFPLSSLANLIEALRDTKKDYDDYAAWGGPNSRY